MNSGIFENNNNLVMDNEFGRIPETREKYACENSEC